MRRRGRPRHHDILTPREWEVLDLLRDGLTNDQIATRFGITHDTAKFHVSEIISKLGGSTRDEAAAFAGRPRVLPILTPLTQAIGRLTAVSAWKLAGGAVLAAATLGLAALAIGVLVVDSDSTPEETALAIPTAEPTPESLTGDEVLDAIVESLLDGDAPRLATRFASTEAREGRVIGGPVGLYQAEPVTTAEWTQRLAAAQRTLVAVVRPIEPDNPAPVPGQTTVPSALIFDESRDYDVLLLAAGETTTEQPWRFSIRDGQLIDVIIDHIEPSEELPGPYPLLYRIYSLLPSPDDDPGRFLVLPPDGYWPIPERVESSGPPPTLQASREPSMAPDGRTGDPAIDALIETLVHGNPAALKREFSDIPARQENCIPIPDNLGACSIEYERVSPAGWIARFASSGRSLYAVADNDPVVIAITADTGADSADGWRFGVRNGRLLDVEFRAGEARPELPPGASPSPTYFWSRVLNYAPDPAYQYEEFLVLPPLEMLPEAPAWYDLSTRSGDAGIDSILALLEARDAEGLQAAFAAPLELTVRDCRFSDPEDKTAAAEAWARDTAERATKLHAISNTPEGYHPAAEHVIEVVLEVNPLRWHGTAIMERDGEIVGVVVGEDCSAGGMSPGPRNYLVPPLDTTLEQFESSRRSGVPWIDAVLDAMQSGDETAWEGLIDWGETTCGNWDYAPPCPPGIEPGGTIDAVSTSGCHGGYATRESPPRPRIGSGAHDELYAVVGVGGASSATILLVNDAGGTTSVGVTTEGLSSIAQGCGVYHPEWRTPQGEPDYLLPPP